MNEKTNKKPKCIKGKNKAFGFPGCGSEVYKLHYGLCPACEYDWLTQTETGKIEFDKRKNSLKSKKVKEEKKENRIQKSKTKIDLMTADKYRSKYLQPVINEISRLIDFGQPCIATDNFAKMNGGHYTSVAANRTICLNLHNIHIQSFESNHFKSGDNLKYRLGLIKNYGESYCMFVENLRQHRVLKLTKSEMIGIHKKAIEIRNNLRKNQKKYNSYERIGLRNTLNIELGIYDMDFCIFEYDF